MNGSKFIFIILLTVFSMKIMEAKDFVVTENYFHSLSTKPSLKNRLSGVKDVFLFEPHNMTQNENYVIDNLKYHLQQMGLRVHMFSADYRAEQQQFGSVYANYHLYDDDISRYWKTTNAIGFVINFVESMGYYTGETFHLKISAVDYPNNWQWNFDIDVPSKGEKLRKQFAKEIGSAWTYNSSFAFIPKSKRGNFDRKDIEQNFKDGNYNPFEGVYEGESYIVGMKKSVNGCYYLIYLDSKETVSDWQQGDIKAELRESTTPGVYKGTWYGRWKQPMQYSFIFDEGSMIIIDDNSKETYIRMFPTETDIFQASSKERQDWGGSAFALKDGYIVTNYHVIEDAKSINISGINGNLTSYYSAEVIATDKTNDIAILKITDKSFNGFGQIPYSITTTTSQVGEDVFVLGYPLTSTMGDEIKLTTGVISSKTGFQGDVSLYQISAPIQPGNSGGPLFDSKGNVIGIVNAKHNGAENVGYAIKASYLLNLIESITTTDILPNSNSVSTLPLTGKVSAERNFVFMINCSNKANNDSF